MATKSCIFYCYKITNSINGKSYIGFAADPDKRWTQHKRDAEIGKGFALAAAIRKHGLEHFHFETICCGRDKRSMLNYIEPALIEQYQSRVSQNGYNVTRGGECPSPLHNHGGSKKGRIVSEETRLRMSVAKKGNTAGAANKGHKRSETTKQKMSAIHMGHIVTNETRTKIGEGNKGKTRSEELKKAISQSLTGHVQSEETKKKRSLSMRGHIVYRRDKKKNKRSTDWTAV